MADISKIKALDGITYNIKDAKAIHDVYDGYDSTSTTAALSANKGKELYDSLGARTVADAISGATAYEKIVTLNNQRVIVYDGLDSSSSTMALSAHQGTGLYNSLGARRIAESVSGATAFDKIVTLNNGITAANDNITAINGKLSGQTVTSITGVSSKYLLRNTSFARSQYIIRGNICYINVNFQCVTPSSSAEQVATGLPLCAINDTTVNAGRAVNWNNTADIGCIVLVQNGILYIKGGVAGSYYATTFSYPVLLS